jgi:hypothetical protein
MREPASDVVIARKRAKTTGAERSVVVRTERNAERNVERRMIPLECLLTSAARGVKTRLAKKGMKDVVLGTNPGTRKMRDVRTDRRSDATSGLMAEARLAALRARQLCL